MCASPERAYLTLTPSARPAVRDRQTAVLAERLARHAHTGGGLAPLVLVAVDHAGHAADGGLVEAARDELGDRQVVLDVALDDRVEHFVGRQRIGVELARREPGA